MSRLQNPDIAVASFNVLRQICPARRADQIRTPQHSAAFPTHVDARFGERVEVHHTLHFVHL